MLRPWEASPFEAHGAPPPSDGTAWGGIVAAGGRAAQGADRSGGRSAFPWWSGGAVPCPANRVVSVMRSSLDP